LIISICSFVVSVCSENALPLACVQSLEFSVVVLPFGARGDSFGGVPVLHKLTVGYTEEIIKGAVDYIAEAFTNTKQKISLCE
jgi:hypothetical protein